jgi:hypothetical protein
LALARKNAQTIEEGRAAIKRRYKIRGRAEVVRRGSLDDLSDVELAVLKTKACFLKAAGFSHTYIADALDTTRSIVGHWFEDPAMRAEVLTINDDMIGGALKLIKTYSIEFIEILVDIARTSDDKTALSAVQDGLDRMGLTKVNKSEGVSVHETRTDITITDPHGLIDKLKDAPPEVQQKAAEHMEALMSITAEHTDANVTTGEPANA